LPDPAALPFGENYQAKPAVDSMKAALNSATNAVQRIRSRTGDDSARRSSLASVRKFDVAARRVDNEHGSNGLAPQPGVTVSRDRDRHAVIKVRW